MTHDSERPSFAIEARQDSTSYSLRLTGELDMATTGELEAAIGRAVESDAARIIVDLEDLEFIDSTGLRTLLMAARRSAVNGDRIRFTRGRGQVAELLRLTAIDQTLRYA